MRWLTGGQVYDVDTGAFRRADIGVDGDRIAALVRRAHRPPATIVVELDGGWLLPGLIDCHVHLTQPTDAARSGGGGDALGRRGRPVHGRGRRSGRWPPG